MKYISIRTKLAVLIGGCSFIIVGLLIMAATVVERNQAVENTRMDARIKAQGLATQVKLDFEKALSTCRTVAQVFSVSKAQSLLNLERRSATAILRGILVHNPVFLAVYSVWEPNAFDNLDVAFADGEGHDQSGRFIPYWVRDPDENYFLEAVREYATSEKGDFYNRARHTRHEVLLDPLLYEVGGVTRLIVSLVTPILLEDVFLGVIGADMHVDWLQQLAETMARANAATVAIVANNGTLAAVSGQPRLAGRFLTDLDTAFMPHLAAIARGHEVVAMQDDQLLIVTPIRIGNILPPWSIMLILSESRMTQQATYNMWRQISLGLSGSALAILLMLLYVERTIKPLEHISAAALKLAQGRLDYQKIRTTRDEIGLVNHSFDQITQSIKNKIEVLQNIAVGDFSREARLRSESDELGRTVNLIVNNIRRIIQQLNLIAREGYVDQAITPVSERDQLGRALADMSASLKRVREENRQQQELQSGRMKLSDRMRGQQELPELSHNIIGFICRHLNLPIGALYATDVVSGELQLTGAYAWQRLQQPAVRFAPAEGLVGQAALSKEIITTGDLPADYVRVQSGLGQASLQFITVVPLIHNNLVHGALELGTLTTIAPEGLTFLKLVAENIAIALHSCRTREHTQHLLAQTRAQADLLQQQQTDLKRSNQELADQTQALKESETRLQLKQEELRQTNRALQAQKEDVEKKSLELAMARDLIEQKARDLEITGKYKSEFLANMSHELRTPLNSILLLSTMLADNRGANLTAKQIELAQTIHASGSDLLNLINDVLDLSKIEAGHMDLHYEEVSLTDLADDLQRKFVHIAQDKKLDFTVAVAGDCARTMYTDPQRVAQVLKNFLSNAFKFTRRGHVGLSIEQAAAGTDLHQSGLAPSATIAFSVSDTGIGLAPDTQKIIFEAFQQADGSTSRHYGGTGLGLSISLEIAKKLGGEIQLQSAPNQGSRFTLLLPRNRPSDLSVDNIDIPDDAAGPDIMAFCGGTPEDLPASTPVPSQAGKTIFEGKTLLLVDDDMRNVYALTSVLEGKGLVIHIARNGRQALEIMAREDNFDLVLMDIMMPEMDGYEAMQAIRRQQRFQKTPIIAMTAQAMPGDRDLCLEKGASDYLTKPFDMDSLMAILLTWLPSEPRNC